MRLIKFSQLMAMGISGLITVTTAQAQTAAVPMAKVNGVAIPQSRLEFIMKARATQGQPDTPEVRKALRDDLIAEEVIAQEALKKGLDRDPDIVAQLEIARQTALVRAYQIDYIKTHPVSDETMRKEYEALKTQMGDKEYKARHVLVATEAEAKDIIARIKRGKTPKESLDIFVKIAKEKSTDTGSNNKGGELDWSPAGNYVAPFAEALTKLTKGQLTEQPVKTPFGWHVIRLDDVRPLKIPPFEEIKNNLSQRVLQRQFEAAVNELRAKAKVE
jgi:peptidyl-prolyl cis-trans isomerase C